jgi:AcrR family transcriptional regulator
MVTKRSLQKVPEPAGQGSARGRILDAAFSAFMERGFAQTSTLEIATRARASKRELYSEFDSKQDMLVACISERAKRLKLPDDLPELRNRETLQQVLVAFGTQLLRETSDPTVIGVFRLAIGEAVRAPKVGRALNDIAMQASRTALREIMRRARDAGLTGGEPVEMAGHFFGLLWGNRMLGLLLGLAGRPDRREIARRAEAAAKAMLRIYAAPERGD